MRFYVKALWDNEAGVFYSESDIVGLHIEAASLDEFVEAMHELAPQMVIENHVTKQDMSRKSLLELVSAIFFQPPNHGPAVAA